VSAGRVLFVGCGPGAPDLLTLRAVRALEAADVVIWNPALLEREVVTAHMRADAELLVWPAATAHDIEATYDRAAAEGLVVARLKGGDPMLFGRMEPELAGVRARGLACEVVPGVSAMGATAAKLLCELATPDAPLLLSDGATVAGAPGGAHRVAIYGANRDPVALQRDLLARGLAASTRCDVAIEVSRRSEMLLSCALDELAETVEDTALGLMAVVLVTPPSEGPPTPPE
jgi:precorrin-4/cobalt-precorrin-4 C11-methyltransferase